jgi:carbon storage regulator
LCLALASQAIIGRPTFVGADSRDIDASHACRDRSRFGLIEAPPPHHKERLYSGAGVTAPPDQRKEPPMLVLSRHRDESIMIGDDIVVTIVDIRGDKVRLGIDAPSDIPVHRQEVYEAIQRENRKATQLKPDDTRDLGNANPSGR